MVDLFNKTVHLLDISVRLWVIFFKTSLKRSFNEKFIQEDCHYGRAYSFYVFFNFFVRGKCY